MSASEAEGVRATANLPRDEALSELLRQNRAFHPVAWGISNHASMGVTAVHALGGDAPELARFTEENFVGGRLPLKASVMEVSAENWRALAGREELVADYQRFLSAELRRLGSRDALLAEFAGELAPSLTHGLFHPIIRLSFALMSDDDAHTVDALAYFMARHGPLFDATDKEREWLLKGGGGDGGDSNGDDSDKAHGSFDEVRRAFAGRPNARGSNFDKVHAWCRSEALRAVVRRGTDLRTEEARQRALRSLARVAVRIYSADPSLFTLHAVTGVQALVDLWPHIRGDAARREALYTYHVWLAALFQYKGAPYLAGTGAAYRGHRPQDWDARGRAARESGHVHTAKMMLTLKVLDAWMRDAGDPDDAVPEAADRLAAAGRPW